MISRAEVKQEAKSALKGHWGWAVGLSLLSTIFVGLISYVTLGLIGMVVAVGVQFSFLRLIDKHETQGVMDGIFSGFTEDRFVAVFLTQLLSGIFVGLWTLLLIVPGIIKGYAYSQATYIVKDMKATGRDMHVTEAITASRELMNGHKWEFFVLQLSFLGWGILAAIPFGLGFLWLTPYMQTTYAAYYRQLAGDKFLQNEDQPASVEADHVQGAEGQTSETAN